MGLFARLLGQHHSKSDAKSQYDCTGHPKTKDNYGLPCRRLLFSYKSRCRFCGLTKGERPKYKGASVDEAYDNPVQEASAMTAADQVKKKALEAREARERVLNKGNVTAAEAEKLAALAARAAREHSAKQLSGTDSQLSTGCPQVLPSVDRNLPTPVDRDHTPYPNSDQPCGSVAGPSSQYPRGHPLRPHDMHSSPSASTKSAPHSAQPPPGPALVDSVIPVSDNISSSSPQTTIHHSITAEAPRHRGSSEQQATPSPTGQSEYQQPPMGHNLNSHSQRAVSRATSPRSVFQGPVRELDATSLTAFPPTRDSRKHLVTEASSKETVKPLREPPINSLSCIASPIETVSSDPSHPLEMELIPGMLLPSRSSSMTTAGEPHAKACQPATDMPQQLSPNRSNLHPASATTISSKRDTALGAVIRSEAPLDGPQFSGTCQNPNVPPVSKVNTSLDRPHGSGSTKHALPIAHRYSRKSKRLSYDRWIDPALRGVSLRMIMAADYQASAQRKKRKSAATIHAERTINNFDRTGYELKEYPLPVRPIADSG